MEAKRTFSIIVLILMIPTAGLTQQKEQQGETIKLSADLVTFTATVFDDKGRYVANLKKEDFSIFEDGVKQDIAFFSSDEKIPVSIGIIFDTSGSMVDKLDGVQDAVKHFIETTKPSDEIFIIRFSNDAKLVCDFTNQKAQLYRTIDNLEANGSTALYDAIYEGLQKVKQGKHKKKALLLITDGNDTSSDADYRETLDLAKKSEVLLYCLGIGHGERGAFGHLLGRDKDAVDINVLRSFSDASGGRSYLLEGEHHSKGEDKIEKAVLEVGGELRQQYSLGYYPANKKKDGSYRSIKVQVAKQGFSARTKKGYFAAQDGQ
jgi:Ca-activated chloride channel family protein